MAAKKIAVVIPAYNEERVIGTVVKNVLQRYTEVVVVDDASRDETAIIAERAGAHVLRHLINRGQGAAIKTGIVFALARGADIVVTFDADGQHMVEDIAILVAPIENGSVDVVLGSRFLGSAKGMPTLKQVTLRAGVLFTRIVSHINVSDTHNGLRAFSRPAASQIRIVQDRMAHASEILEEISRLRLRYREVPVQIKYTQYSQFSRHGSGQGNLEMFKIAFKFLLSKFFQ